MDAGVEAHGHHEIGYDEQEDEHVGRALWRTQVLNRREPAVRVLSIIGNELRPLDVLHRKMRTEFLGFITQNNFSGI